jgi:hypothetical protein
MYRHAVRGVVAIPALAGVLMLAAGCGSSAPSPSSTQSNSPSSTPPSSTPPSSSSASGTAAACQKINTTLGKAPSTLGGLVLHPASARPAVTAFINQLKQEAASAGDATLTSAVDDFSNSVQQALGSLASNPSSVSTLISNLTKDSTKITNACSSAGG